MFNFGLHYRSFPGDFRNGIEIKHGRLEWVPDPADVDPRWTIARLGYGSGVDKFYTLSAIWLGFDGPDDVDDGFRVDRPGNLGMIICLRRYISHRGQHPFSTVYGLHDMIKICGIPPDDLESITLSNPAAFD